MMLGKIKNEVYGVLGNGVVKEVRVLGNGVVKEVRVLGNGVVKEVRVRLAKRGMNPVFAQIVEYGGRV